jgi:enterobactin synthetase component D / holo-[acyl-carrier protein] synthase
LISARHPTLPTLLAGLPVVTEELTLPAALPAPDAADLAAVAGMADKRRIEYLAGRHCARLALARLGVRDHVLRAGADRAPVWPAGIVGSITHTGAAQDGFCGVAVARSHDLVALGIDAELDRPLPDELLQTVLTARERDALLRRPAESRGQIAALIFSAKESVYKALSPRLGIFIEFEQVDVDVDAEDGNFTAEVRLPGAPAMPPLSGRLLLTPGLLLTAVAIGPSSSVG